MKYSQEIDLRDRDELLDKLWQVNLDTYTQKQLDYLADFIEELYADRDEIPDLTDINDIYRFQAEEILREAGFFEEEKDVCVKESEDVSLKHRLNCLMNMPMLGATSIMEIKAIQNRLDELNEKES